MITSKRSMISTSVQLALIGASMVSLPSGANDAVDQLWNGSRTIVSFTNYFKSADEFVTNKDVNHEDFATEYEWGQSVNVIYRSGDADLMDTGTSVNFAVGYSHMFKLDDRYVGGTHSWNAGQKIFQSSDCSWKDGIYGNGTYRCNDTEGFGKLAVANIGLNWDNGEFLIGDGFFNVGMITTSSDDDPLLASYRGMAFEQKFESFMIDGGLMTGFMSGNEDTMGDLTGGSNYYDPYPLTYDYLYTIGVKGRFHDDAGYRVGYGEAKDYVRRYHTELWYKHRVSSQSQLWFKTQYYFNRKAGDLWTKDINNRAPDGDLMPMANFDEFASALSYEVDWRYDAFSLLYGFTRIDAPMNVAGDPDKTGSFSYGFGNAKGYLKLPTTGGYHGFRRDGTDAHVIALSYDLRHLSLPDFAIQYRYHWGETDVKNKQHGYLESGKAIEHVAEIKYIPSQGMLKGFNFSYKQSFYRPDDTYAQLQADDVAGKADTTTVKMVIGYSFRL